MGITTVTSSAKTEDILASPGNGTRLPEDVDSSGE